MLSLLQAFRFADDDTAHVERLLHWAELPVGAHVLDLGGGAGFMAARMLDRRPDLSICLVDQDQASLDRADPRLRRCCADIRRIPAADRSFDAALCCYAIGYVDAAEVFAEVRRLVRPGGVLFIVDMVPVAPSEDRVLLFGYSTRSRAVLERCAQESGLRLDVYMEPVDLSGWGEAQFPGYFQVLFGEVRAAIWRFRV